MKTSAVQSLRRKLAADEPAYGLWVTLEAPTISEMAVALGLDWIVIDAEHGHLDWKEIVEHLRATVRSDTVALIRIAELNVGLIKRALDIGADGVVVPWVESAEQVRQAVAFAHYPPEGLRGIGAERATCWGRCFPAHAGEANEHVLVVPIVETVRAGQNIEQLCQVPGVEMFFLGPADYSSTAGFRGQWEGPGVAEELLAIKDVIRRHGKQCGVVSTSHEDLLSRREQGFRMLALGLDGGLLLRGLTGALSAAGLERPISPGLAPAAPVAAKSGRGPARTAAGQPNAVELAPGVKFAAQAGGHNQARGLTVGVVEFQPGACLPYHIHPHGEAITLLSGEAAVEVEGRRYLLRPLDNAWIPAGLPHQAINVSARSPARFHIAMSSHAPSRTLVETAYRTRTMPPGSTGQTAAERLSPQLSAAWQDRSPGVRGQAAYHRQLGSQGLAGGLLRLAPGVETGPPVRGGDIVWTLLTGELTAAAAGERFSLAAGDALLLPAGFVVRLTNSGSQPAELIWASADDSPL